MSEYQEVVETSDDGKLRVILRPDHDAERPSDNGDWWTSSVLTYTGGNRWTGAGKMEAERDPEDRLAAWQHFHESYAPTTPDADDAFIRYMRIFHGIEVFEEAWGSERTRALVWLEPAERERVGIPDTYPARDVIELEVQEHNRWADGEVYGYTVQQLVTWSTDADLEDRDAWEDTEDSCWGFIGYEYAEEQAREALAGHKVSTDAGEVL